MEKKILVVDDSYFFREQMNLILKKAGYEVITATTGEEVFGLVRMHKPDLVVLDVILPDMDGFAVCKLLRDSESNNLMPIILLTSKDDQDDKLHGLELGADDYITKPFNERELLSRIRNTLRRIDRNRSANPLTGLRGNLEIQRDVDSRIEQGKKFAVIYIDLDNFKAFNDVYGFARGDHAIKMTADILIDRVHNSDDFVGHIGGDDFVFITTPDTAEEVCRETIEIFDKRIRTLYNDEDVKSGCITTKNRRGDVETFPIMTVSMGVVTNMKRTFESFVSVSDVSSELKKVLKAKSGSNYMVDRRVDERPAESE